MRGYVGPRAEPRRRSRRRGRVRPANWARSARPPGPGGERGAGPGVAPEAGGAVTPSGPFVDVDAAEATADAAYQDAVRARGVPMPGVVRTPDGEALVEVDGAPVRVYDWVDVQARTAARPAEVGRLVAQIHDVVVTADEPMARGTSIRSAPPAGTSGRASCAGAARRSRPTWSVSCPSWSRSSSCWSRCAASQWCHLDLWADNILRATPGDGLVVLDWENSGPGRPCPGAGAAALRPRAR